MPTATPAAATTDVLGYFNKNSFPLQITSDHLGINYQVAPKSYVEDRSKRKINDPRLDFYVSSGLLSKEFAKSPVPVVMLAGSPVAGAGPSSSVTASKPVPASRVPVQGTITPPGLPNRMPAAVAAQPPVGTTSIHAMSVSQAMKSGLIPKPDRRDHFEKLPNEDQTGQAAQSAPSIDRIIPTPRLVVPRNLKLRSVDTSSVPALESEDAIASAAELGAEPLPAEPAEPAEPELSVTPVTVSPASAAQKTGAAIKAAIRRRQAAQSTAQAAPAPARPRVEFDGKKYSTIGNLMQAMRKKFNGDEAMVQEAIEPFRSQLAPPGALKPVAVG